MNKPLDFARREAPARAADPTPSIEPIVVERRLPRWARPLLMFGVPLLMLAVGGWFWWAGVGQVSTDNAAVQQNKVSISPEVAGRVVAVFVAENQRVRRGDPLFRLDPVPFQIAYDQADAALLSARSQVRQLRATVGARSADVASARARVVNAAQAFDRQRALLARGFTTRAAYDGAVAALRQAEAEQAAGVADVASATAATGGGGAIDAHPLVRVALAQREQAALNLRRTDVRAPSDGIVSQAGRLQVGQSLPALLPVISLVVDGNAWVEANFKETQLADLRVGQPAIIRLDLYPDLQLSGRVASVGAGTGAEFAVLPAQNATGNWVKVVQRVPVRVAILGMPADRPLIAGMSARVVVDTGRR